MATVAELRAKNIALNKVDACYKVIVGEQYIGVLFGFTGHWRLVIWNDDNERLFFKRLDTAKSWLRQHIVTTPVERAYSRQAQGG